MKYEYKPSFDKTLGKMHSIRKEEASSAISELIDFFETGKKPRGLGLKHLKDTFWEIRFNIRDRIIFTMENDTVSFIIAGNHHEIKRFLKRI
ncbi:MAG: hypothetical protein FJW68_09475 [Actinobacteria bacterium]|nr:hypothetical protein [Actinomycetota bacterium]